MLALEMDCEEKSQLVKAYSVAAEEFSRVVDELHSKMATCGKPQYEEIRHRTEQARMNMEQARLNLDRHISQHQC